MKYDTVIAGIPVTVERKRVKNLRVRIIPPDGKVLVSVPMLLPEATVNRFITEKAAWIQAHSEHIRQSQAPQSSFREGGGVQLFGRELPLHISAGKKPGCSLENGSLYLTLPNPLDEAQCEKLFYAWARSELENRIRFRMPVFETKTGLHCSSWYIRDMKSRWGSCNVKTGRIALNLRLVHKPPECLDYVLLHELAHLIYPNHGAGFHAYLTKYMPDWKLREKQLNPARTRI